MTAHLVRNRPPAGSPLAITSHLTLGNASASTDHRHSRPAFASPTSARAAAAAAGRQSLWLFPRNWGCGDSRRLAVVDSSPKTCGQLRLSQPAARHPQRAVNTSPYLPTPLLSDFLYLDVEALEDLRLRGARLWNLRVQQSLAQLAAAEFGGV